MKKANIIAFYLPQFHPFKENDQWWGAGFTEWTNVAKARKLFPGHLQPKLPGELGFYDLRLEDTRIKQAELARQYGIDAFCYYYYRLNPTLHLMEQPIQEVLQSGKPDFPFMFCWANHDWIAKDWNGDDSFSGRVLARQKYNGEVDNKNYFNELLPYFKDNRYIKIDNCPLFAIYKVRDIPDIDKFMKLWNTLAQENGFDGIKFLAYSENWEKDKYELEKYDFYKIISSRLQTVRNINTWYYNIGRYFRRAFRLPQILRYQNVIKRLISDDEKDERLCPVIMPNWDPSPRRGSYCHLWINCTPALFRKHLMAIFEIIKKKHNKMVFVKSWNEWGEGNYLEPDRNFGRAYLEILKSVRSDFNM